MSQAVELYGTDAAPPQSEALHIGDVTVTLEQGALRHLKIAGHEVIRGLAFLVRDRDWGTTEPHLREVSRDLTDGSAKIGFRAVYQHGAAQMAVDLHLVIAPDHVEFAAEGLATGAFETNRTGFTVLHPASAAGCPVKVDHSDGPAQDTRFPLLIDPWQPFMDITALEHRSGGIALRCAFEGDTFEMEDQRQWGDASFKTYNRPLAKPWPYQIGDGERVEQRVRLTWQTMAKARAADPVEEGTQTAAPFPETAVLVSPDQAQGLLSDSEALLRVAPQRLLCHVDDTAGDAAEQFQAFARLQKALPRFTYDLELISGFAQPPLQALGALRDAMDQAGFSPASVLVCPSVDRQSTPPGSDWPDCPPLEDIHAASASPFDDCQRGGGMVSFFPELNRKRPPVDQLGFVSHGLCPIVHAADDLSVMETLEAIPHITRSARAIIGAKEYRIGPCTIAMRHNPYGQRTIPNPGRDRVCMADDDPRHGAQFGAAFVMGLATALAPAGAQVWTPAEASGPRGLHGPLVDALATLARLAGQPVHQATVKDGLADLLVGKTRITANLCPTPHAGLGAYGWRSSS